jgi:hypothetical protein
MKTKAKHAPKPAMKAATVVIFKVLVGASFSSVGPKIKTSKRGYDISQI